MRPALLRHVAFVLPDLRAGGAERLTIDLMRGFVARGAKVDLVLLEQAGEFLALLPEEVTIVCLDAPRLRNALVPLRRYMRARRPDAVLAAMWPLTTLTIAAAIGLPNRPRIVVSDHCALLDQYASSKTAVALLRATIRASYRFADAIVAVSRGLADEIAELAGVPRERTTAIYNPIPTPLRSDPGCNPWAGARDKRILGVGRLKAQKNFALLIEAFAILRQSEEATLAIVGDGDQRGLLEALASERGVGDRVMLPGFCATPGDWYAGADVFVLSSDYEGFGNVLVEAMHCGVSVVSTDCPYGPSEVVGDGRWGRLVPVGDATALAAAIQAALAAPSEPEEQRRRAAEFSVERAVDRYWSLCAGEPTSAG